MNVCSIMDPEFELIICLTDQANMEHIVGNIVGNILRENRFQQDLFTVPHKIVKQVNWTWPFYPKACGVLSNERLSSKFKLRFGLQTQNWNYILSLILTPAQDFNIISNIIYFNLLFWNLESWCIEFGLNTFKSIFQDHIVTRIQARFHSDCSAIPFLV